MKQHKIILIILEPGRLELVIKISEHKKGLKTQDVYIQNKENANWKHI